MKINMEKNILNHWTASIAENVLFQQLGDVDGEVVLLDMQSGGYFGLNEVGSRIWCLIQEGKSVGAIFASLTEEYDVSEQDLRNDIYQFLTDLSQRGLIEINEHGG